MGIRKLNSMDFFSLYVGGKYGSTRLAAATASTTKATQIHMIKVLVDATTFSIMGAVEQDGTVLNMLTGLNGLASETWNAGDLVFAPGGGYISAYTASEKTEPYTMMSTNLDKQEP